MYAGASRPRRQSEIGTLDQCATCREWWPIDRAFFANRTTKDCIACEIDRGVHIPRNRSPTSSPARVAKAPSPPP